MTELTTAVIGLLILLSILCFVLYLNKKQKNKKQAAARYLQQLIETHNLEIDSKEEQRYMVLALDKQNRKLLYVKRPMDDPHSTLIDLKEVRTCRVNEVAQTFFMDDEKKRKDTLTTQIALELFYQKKEEVFAITFYDYIDHSSNQLPELRSIANDWNKQVKGLIGDTKA